MKGGKGRLVIGGVAVYLDPHTLHGEALTTRSVHSRRRKKKNYKGTRICIRTLYVLVSRMYTYGYTLRRDTNMYVWTHT